MISKVNFAKLALGSLAILVVIFLFSSPAILGSAYPGLSSQAAIPSTQAGPNSGCTTRCIYVGDYGSDQLSMISSQTNKLLATIKLPTGGVAFGVTYVPKTKMLWIGDYYQGKVLVYNPATNTLAKQISAVGAAFMTLAPNGNMYVAGFGNTTYTVISTTTYKVVTTITACGLYPEFIAYNPKDGMIYAPARLSCYDIINPGTNTATPVTLGSGPTGVAVNQKTGTVYISDSSNDVVYAVKGSTLLKTISSSEFTNGRLWGVVYDPATKEVYVAATGVSLTGNTVVPITSTNKVLTAVTVGAGPDFGCYISTQKNLMITNTHNPAGQRANVTLINTSNKVVATIKLAKTSSQPYGCAET